jgi:NAD(P)H dehydrogenase (quinone)
MMKILIIYAHPQDNSFQARLHHCAKETLTAREHVVDDCDLYAERFQPVLSKEELCIYHNVDLNYDLVETYVKRLREAEVLMFIFPTWWYGMPAILRGYFDRVWLPGVSFGIKDGKTYALLSNIKRMAVITTCGSPYWLNRWYVGDLNRKFFTRGVRRLLAPNVKISWLAQYNMDRADAQTRSRFATKVRKLCEKI